MLNNFSKKRVDFPLVDLYRFRYRYFAITYILEINSHKIFPNKGIKQLLFKLLNEMVTS